MLLDEEPSSVERRSYLVQSYGFRLAALLLITAAFIPGCGSASRDAVDAKMVVLYPGGVAGFRFGSSQEDVALEVTDVLGDPTYRSGAVKNACGPEEPTVELVVWHDLIIEFSSLGGSDRRSFVGWLQAGSIYDPGGNLEVRVAGNAAAATAGGNRRGGLAASFLREYGSSARFESSHPSEYPGPSIMVGDMSADSDWILISLDEDNDVTAKATSLLSGQVGCGE